MEENRKHKLKTSNVLTMIGSGKHALLIEVERGERIMLDDGTIVIAGETPEEARAKIDKQLDEIVKNGPRDFKEELKEKPKQLIKRIFNKNRWKTWKINHEKY